MRANKIKAALILLLCGTTALVFAQEAAPTKATQCFACHGADGMSKMPDAPNLAGQNEAYLVKALHDFKSGKRENEVMNLMAKPLSDEDINQVAAYYSRLAISSKKP